MTATKSIAFDRAASYYDETRGFPPGEEQAATGLFAKAGHLTDSSRVLEVGIGTGRIALPLSAYVGQIMGADISRPMIERLIAKRSTQRVYPVEADGTILPFADQSFDAAVAVHIFHLIPNGRGVLAEIARILKPGAPFIHGWEDGDYSPVSRSIWSPASEEQQVTNGVSWQDNRTFPLSEGWQFFGDELQHSYTFYKAPQAELDELQNRVWSRTWTMSDEQIAEAVGKLQAHLAANFDDPLQPVANEGQFHVQAFLLNH